MWFVVVFIASLAASLALAPKIPEPKPAGLSELNVPTAEPGRPIPIPFGTVRLEDPNVVWYGDLKTTPIKSGGK